MLGRRVGALGQLRRRKLIWWPALTRRRKQSARFRSYKVAGGQSSHQLLSNHLHHLLCLNLVLDLNQRCLGNPLSEFLFESLPVGKLLWKNLAVHCLFGTSVEFIQRHNLYRFIQLAPKNFHLIL